MHVRLISDFVRTSYRDVGGNMNTGETNETIEPFSSFRSHNRMQKGSYISDDCRIYPNSSYLLSRIEIGSRSGRDEILKTRIFDYGAASFLTFCQLKISICVHRR